MGFSVGFEGFEAFVVADSVLVYIVDVSVFHGYFFVFIEVCFGGMEVVVFSVYFFHSPKGVPLGAYVILFSFKGAPAFQTFSVRS